MGFDRLVVGDTKTYLKATVSASTDDVALVTPTSGKRIRVHNVFMLTASATSSTFEASFCVAAAITTNPDNAIAITSLVTTGRVSESVPFGDSGPLGAVDEVVSMRTATDITSNGTFVIVYNEE